MHKLPGLTHDSSIITENFLGEMSNGAFFNRKLQRRCKRTMRWRLKCDVDPLNNNIDIAVTTYRRYFCLRNQTNTILRSDRNIKKLV